MTCGNCGKQGHRRNQCPEPTRGMVPSPLRELARQQEEARPLSLAEAARMPEPAKVLGMAAAAVGATHSGPPADELSEGWAHVRAEARRMFPDEPDPHFRFLLWLNYRRTLANLHALDPLWLEGFRLFYASGKPVMVARKGLRAGGSVSACCALLADALDTQREVDGSTILVFPIMSSSRDEATDRFVTIRANLHACGIAPKKKKGEDEWEGEDVVLPGGIGGTYESKRSLSGGGIIEVTDSQGHVLQFRILPAMRRAAVGYTGGGGFLDETDLWPADSELHVNPADVVITDVLKRITTQPTARIYIFSASYYAESAHSRRIDMGDTSAQHIMRIGVEGARRDTEARRALAAKIHSDDERLLAPADPMSPDLPAWVMNPTASPIERCYQLSDDKLGQMLGLYGGRANENAGAEGMDSLAKATVKVVPTPDRAALSDVVIGVAPSAEGSPEWGIVVVGMSADGHVVVGDSSVSAPAGEVAGLLAILGAGHGASVLAVAKEHEARLQAEIAAGLAGLGSYAPPVWAADVYDKSSLRTGPLRTLLDASRLRVAVGLTGLVKSIASHRPAVRSARVEALAVAVARLVACYPWVTEGAGEAEPPQGPRPVGGLMVRGVPGSSVTNHAYVTRMSERRSG